MALTPFQERKMTQLFNFWDGDNNGYLERDDYMNFATRICRERGWSEGSPEWENVHAVQAANWEQAQKFADTNNDNRVTLKEWHAFMDAMLQDEAMYRAGAQDIRDAVFNAIDRDNDDQVTVDDWAFLFKLYRWDENQAEVAFKAMDRDGDGKVTKDEIDAALDAFFRSDNPNETHQYLFGPLPEPA